jgi:2-polyprenyl-3-methyl-5-hydroxy-6-metoxy-1,4-benzoquinol methylase
MPDHTFIDWNQRYADKNAPWDTGEPSMELQKVLQEDWFPPGRMLEFGCGTGTNAIFLAQMDFTVTAVDIAPLALEQAREKAMEACVNIDFRQADALKPPDLGAPFPFVFDRGVYHHLREVNLPGFLATLAKVTQPGGFISLSPATPTTRRPWISARRASPTARSARNCNLFSNLCSSVSSASTA